MTYQEIRNKLAEQTVNVEFIKMSEVGFDEKPDNRMRARLISIEDSEDNEPGYPPELHVWFDLSAFMEYNKTVAKHDWLDDNGTPCLTWFESGHYPANGRVDFYVDGPMEAEATVFKMIEVGCGVCNGDIALLDLGDVRIDISQDGRLKLFLGDNVEPKASVYIRHCPECGRAFQKDD